MRKHYLLLILMTLSLFLLNVPYRVQGTTNDNLIARWQFNEGSGLNVSDSSGNGHHGVYDNGSGSEHWNSSSFNTEASYCIDFDDSEDQFINITDHNDLSFTDGAGSDVAFSVDFWFNLDDTSAYHWLFAKTESSVEEYSCGVDTNGRLLFQLIESIFDSIWVRTANGDVVAGNWYHFAFSYNGNESNTGMEIYLNGSNVVDSRGGSDYDGMANLDTNLYIGRVGLGTATDFDGKFDEVRIWNATLTSSEVTDLFDNAPDLLTEITTTTTVPITTTTTTEGLIPDIDYPPLVLLPSGLSDMELILILSELGLIAGLGLIIIRRASKK